MEILAFKFLHTAHYRTFIYGDTNTQRMHIYFIFYITIIYDYVSVLSY